MQTAGILPIWYAELLNDIKAYTRQHVPGKTLCHGIQRVNVVVTLEDKSTLNIAHMTSTLLSPIHFSKSHKVVCTGSIKIAGVYVDAYTIYCLLT